MPETHVIVDTGPLVAFLIKEEAQHRWVSDQFQRLPAPFVTCEPVLTETFFLLRRIPNGPTKFFALLDSGLLHVDFPCWPKKLPWKSSFDVTPMCQCHWPMPAWFVSQN